MTFHDLNRAHARHVEGNEPIGPEPRPVMRDRTAIALIILIAIAGFIGCAANERWAEKEEARVEAQQEQVK